MLVDVTRLEREYFERLPDVDPTQLVSFGTSGHRGSSLRGSFNEAHILAITQAICDYRRTQGTNGPLYMGKDTHALSEPELEAEFGTMYYTRIDAAVTLEQNATLAKLSPEAVTAAKLAGEPITAQLTHAPGRAPIGGLKVVAENGWFAARPSGSENIYKIYAESFKDQGHLDAIVSEAQEIVNDALKSFDSAYQQREVR